MFDYTGKVVAITGASSGLGKQMAEGYAKQGANLVLMARRVERLEESAKQWKEAYGVDVLPVACDVTNAESIANAVKAARNTSVIVRSSSMMQVVKKVQVRRWLIIREKTGISH